MFKYKPILNMQDYGREEVLLCEECGILVTSADYVPERKICKACVGQQGFHRRYMALGYSYRDRKSRWHTFKIEWLLKEFPYVDYYHEFASMSNWILANNADVKEYGKFAKEWLSKAKINVGVKHFDEGMLRTRYDQLTAVIEYHEREREIVKERLEKIIPIGEERYG